MLLRAQLTEPKRLEYDPEGLVVQLIESSSKITTCRSIGHLFRHLGYISWSSRWMLHYAQIHLIHRDHVRCNLA